MNSARRRFRTVALTILVFAAGLPIGAWLSIERRAAPISAGTQQRPVAPGNVASSPSSDSQMPRAFQSDEEMLTAIMSAVSEDEPLLRAHGLYDAIHHLSSAELSVLFVRAIGVKDRERRGPLLDAILARWASIDPAAASAAVRPYMDRIPTMRGFGGSLEEAVCQAWAKAMPEPAFAKAMSTPDSRAARTVAQIALQSLAGDNPLRQLEILERFPATRLRGEMCEDAINALAATDCAKAEAYLNLLTDPRQRARMLSEILGKLTERDPPAGLARIATLSSD